LLRFATGLYDNVLIRMIREGHRIPTNPFLTGTPGMESLRTTIEKCLFGANRRVVEQANNWGMKFMAVSDLNGSSVCRLIFRSDIRVLVVVYSGMKRQKHHSLWPSSKGPVPLVNPPQF
jgi:hypothetical protein